MADEEADQRDTRIIAEHADALNVEAEDTLDYQVIPDSVSDDSGDGSPEGTTGFIGEQDSE